MDDHDLERRLDRSIGPAPDGGPQLTDLLTAGHRAVRRRRAFAAVASAAAVVVVAGGFAVATGGDAGRATPPVAVEPTASPDPTPSATPSPQVETQPDEAEAQAAMEAVDFDSKHRMTLAPGVEIERKVDNPLGLEPPAASTALTYTFLDRTYWRVDYTDPARSGGSWMWAGGATGTFDEYVAQSAADLAEQRTSDEAWPGMVNLDLVTFVEQGAELRPADGVTIVEQRAGVDVGESFAGPGDDTAAAEVVAADGKTYYVLARRSAGTEPQYIAVTRADGGTDLDAFLDYCRGRYTEGEGGLL